MAYFILPLHFKHSISEVCFFWGGGGGDGRGAVTAEMILLARNWKEEKIISVQMSLALFLLPLN